MVLAGVEARPLLAFLTMRRGLYKCEGVEALHVRIRGQARSKRSSQECVSIYSCSHLVLSNEGTILELRSSSMRIRGFQQAFFKSTISSLLLILV